MTTTKLKPCPFCGGEAQLRSQKIYGGESYWVLCRKCFSTQEPYHTKAVEAIAAWNRRYPVKGKGK